jgi:hypothetical protein
MSALSDVVVRFSLSLGPAGIVIGYVLALFGVVAGVVAYPFSSIWLGLLVVVIGAFFGRGDLRQRDRLAVFHSRRIPSIDGDRTSASLWRSSRLRVAEDG